MWYVQPKKGMDRYTTVQKAQYMLAENENFFRKDVPDSTYHETYSKTRNKFFVKSVNPSNT